MRDAIVSSSFSGEENSRLLIPMEMKRSQFFITETPWEDRVESCSEPLTSQLVNTTGMRVGHFLSLAAGNPSHERLELRCP